MHNSSYLRRGGPSDPRGTEVDELLEAAIADAGLSFERVKKHPQHHVFPQNARAKAWFAERGIDVDEYVVNMYTGEHQALHGGGDWVLGRSWIDEWNNEMMRRLRDAELYKQVTGGGRLTPSEIVQHGRDLMTKWGIDHLPFERYQKGWLPE